jgi:hypothetical protein
MQGSVVLLLADLLQRKCDGFMQSNKNYLLKHTCWFKPPTRTLLKNGQKVKLQPKDQETEKVKKKIAKIT